MTVSDLPSRQSVTSTALPGVDAADHAGELLGAATSLPSTAVITSPALMPAFLRRAVVLRFGDQRALGAGEAERFGDLRRHRLDLHAEPAALDGAVLHQVADHFTGRGGRNGEGDADIAARRREDRGVDADHFAVEVEGRAAGIAAVHRRVDLEEVVIGTGADVAAARRDDAGRHRAAEAERIADRDDPVADANLGVVGEVDIGELALPSSTLSTARSVRGSVPISLASSSSPLSVTTVNVGAALDDVVVGDEIAVLGDEEAGALRDGTRRRVAAVAAR